jgi:hypothetical protein
MEMNYQVCGKTKKIVCMFLGERSQSENATCYIVPTNTFQEREIYRDNKKTSRFQGLGEKGMHRQSTEDL